MNLTDMIAFDIDTIKSYSTDQAEQLANDVIACLAGGVEGRYQAKLKSILVAAKKHAVDEPPTGSADEVRSEVLQRINEAEARGDRRTARYLQNSMAKRDSDELDNSGEALIGAANKFIEDDVAAREAAKKEQQDELIRIRTQEIWHAHGWEITEDEARQQAELEVRGRPDYEDDINEPTPEKPDRQEVLDEANRRGP